MKKITLFVVAILFTTLCIAQERIDIAVPSAQDKIDMMYSEYELTDDQKAFIDKYFTAMENKSLALSEKKALLKEATTKFEGEELQVLKTFSPDEVIGRKPKTRF